VNRPGRGAARPVLKPAQRRRRGKRRIALAGRLYQHIVSQRRVIVQIFIALHQPKHPPAQHVDELVPDALGIARIGKHPRHRVDQPRRRSSFLSSNSPPSLDTSPPSKFASTRRRLNGSNSICFEVQSGIGGRHVEIDLSD